jgi:hypothetical protein
LPPIKQGCEFHSLDTTGNAKTQEKAIEVGFDGSPSHLELFRNLLVVTALEQQIGNLFLARTQ